MDRIYRIYRMGRKLTGMKGIEGIGIPDLTFLLSLSSPQSL
jgi:hypothetical protein